MIFFLTQNFFEIYFDTKFIKPFQAEHFRLKFCWNFSLTLIILFFTILEKTSVVLLSHVSPWSHCCLMFEICHCQTAMSTLMPIFLFYSTLCPWLFYQITLINYRIRKWICIVLRRNRSRSFLGGSIGGSCVYTCTVHLTV